MGRVTGKVAFVTGAGRGMGRSHAVHLAEQGADILAVDICHNVPGVEYDLSSVDDLAQTAKLVKDTGQRIITGQVDIRDRDGIAAFLKDGVAQMGRLDVVVANAAVSSIAPWDQVTPEMWNRTLEINLTGTWYTATESAPHLIRSGGGSVILISSATAVKAMPFHAPYVAAKAGVSGLGRALAMEWSAHNIRVNTIHPGAVATGMGQGGNVSLTELFAIEPRMQQTLNAILDVRLADPSDISHAVVYLASDESRYVTATSAMVDAGISEY